MQYGLLYQSNGVIKFGPRQANLILIAYASSEGSGETDLRCSVIQAVSQEEPSDRKPDPWPLWMAGHAQLKFVMMECSKTQIRLTGPIWRDVCSERHERLLMLKMSQMSSDLKSAMSIQGR